MKNAFIILLIFFFGALPLKAEKITSAYMDLNIDQCVLMQIFDYGTQYACEGYKGYPMLVGEGDLKFFVSYGFNAPNEEAAKQTIYPYNFLDNNIEWRLKTKNGAFFPFATILQFSIYLPDEYLESQKTEQEILVVTKLEENNTCHIAYIDIKKTNNANEIAREIADQKAVDFNCETDEIIRITNE